MASFKRINIRFRTKLFLYTTFLLTSVIAIINYHSTAFLETVLVNSSRSSSLDSAEKIGLEIQSRFEVLESNLDNSISIDFNSKQRNELPRLKQFQKSNNVITQILLYRMAVGGEPTLFGKVVADSAVSESEAQKFLKDKKDFKILTGMYRTVKDSIFFAKSYDVPDSKDKILVLMILSKKVMNSNRYVDNGLKFRILDEGLYDVETAKAYLDNIHPTNRKAVTDQVKKDLWSGSIKSLNRQKTQMLIHYYRIPVYDYVVMIEENYEEIVKKIADMSREITKWIAVVYLLSIFMTLFFASRITSDLQMLNAATRHISQGNLGYQVKLKSRDEIYQLSEQINFMSRKLHEFLNQVIQKTRMEAEMKAGRLVQEAFLKNISSSNGSIHIEGRVIAASECSGDWFGSYSVSDGVEFVVLADVTGHGVGSAIVSSLIYGATVNYVNAHKRDRNLPIDPAKFLHEVNELLYDCFVGTMGATMIALVIIEEQNKIEYCIAGHPHPIYVEPENEAMPQIEGQADRKQKKGTRLLIPKNKSTNLVGLSLKSEFANNTLDFKDGEMLFLYTDGLVELQNVAGKDWGVKKMMKSLKNFKQGGLDATLKAMVGGVDAYREGVANSDDITIIAIKRMQDRLIQPLDLDAVV